MLGGRRGEDARQRRAALRAYVVDELPEDIAHLQDAALIGGQAVGIELEDLPIHPVQHARKLDHSVRELLLLLSDLHDMCLHIRKFHAVLHECEHLLQQVSGMPDGALKLDWVRDELLRQLI
eukprot:2053769-Pyramimonas_sp.AAC.1